jgi:pseudomonalisin
MISRGKCLVLILSFTFLAISLAPAETVPRITQSIDSRRMAPLRDNVHPLARPEFDQGALDPSKSLERVTIVFQRTAEQQQALEKLAAEQQDPNSPNYHHWLTPADFGAKFGLADSDVARVKDWLAGQGFRVDEVPAGKGSISFSGSAGQIAAAFRTELHQYAVNGEVHFANATSPEMPAAMAGIVAAIRSLNDFKPRARSAVRRIKPDFTSGILGSNFVTPDDFAALYNLKALYSAGIDGSGQKIAVIGQTAIRTTDIATFRKLSGLDTNVPQLLLTTATNPGEVSGDIDEASLDVEWAGAVAKNAQIIYVYSNNGAFDAMVYAINHNTAPVISISYGECEPDAVSFGDTNSLQPLLLQGTVQGQTIVGPSGDSGAADCDFSSDPNTPINSASKGLAVDFPASSPYVTSVGGSSFSEVSGTTYWNPTSNNLSGSALFYIPEIVWNETASSVAAGTGLFGAGGGVSSTFVKPSWQAGTGVPADGKRDVPDLSLNASPDHDGYITCSQGSCAVCFPGATGQAADANCPSSSSPGFRLTAAAGSTQWNLHIVGGTSAGVPTFAGLVALINQKSGGNQGNVNPRLYQLFASTPYVFHDITQGDNLVPCTAGTKDCPSSGNIGYAAGAGYDRASGLGSVDGFNLISNWKAAASADFGVAFSGTSVTVAKGASVSVPVVVQRQNNFNGTVTLACSSSVASITCAVNPGTVNPDGSSSVTITASASASNSRTPLLPWLGSAFGVAAMFGIGAGSKRSKRALMLCALLAIALLLGLAACGGGGSSSSNSGNNTSGAGGGTGSTGTVTVTATSTSPSLSHTSQIAVTVK